MNLYVTTSDKGIQIIETFQYIFNNVCKQNIIKNVVILGFTPPKFQLDHNFKFISLGKDTGPQSFTNDLFNFFSQIDDQQFIITPDDTPPIKINNELLEFAQNITKNNRFGRMCLTADIVTWSNQYSIEKSYDQFDVIKKYDNSDFKLSLVFSIWNKSFFIENLKRLENCNPWQFEVDKYIQNDKTPIYGFAKQYPAHILHFYKRGIRKANWDKCNYFPNSVYLDQSQKEYCDKLLPKSL